MPKLYEERTKDGVREIYLGEGDWVSAKELQEWGAEEVRGRQEMDAQDVKAEQETCRED